LDLWPLAALIPGASTVNASIDCYTKASFHKSELMTVKVKSPDFESSFSFSGLEDFLQTEDSKTSLLKEAFSVLKNPELGVGEWILESESPAGSGLGGSSSLLISILKVLFELEEVSWTEKTIIESAKNIETRVLKTPAGIQDYFSPVQEGINQITYLEKGFKRAEISDHFEYWSQSLSLVDSKIKHHSGMNNWEILKDFIDGDARVSEALKNIAEVSKETVIALKNKDIKSLKGCFDKELSARKNVSTSYINEELQTFLNKLSELPGVQALKVCGAGGGGCVLILHSPENREHVHEELKNKGFSLLPFKLVQKAAL
jgi:D-glycero-alpha-D-manno-heptose-7-phosphate kinase